MANFTHNEIETLMKFRLSVDKNLNQLMRPGLDFLDAERLQQIFEEDLEEKLHTKKKPVIGSMLVKSYAFLAALVLHAMSRYDKGMNSTLDNVSIQTNDTGPFWLPSFYFENLDASIPGADREKWRADVVQTLFSENISKVITMVSKHAKVAKVILWENVSAYIFWMYETLIDDESLSDEQRAIIREDFLYVVEGASPEIFAERSRNPLTQFFLPKKNNIRMRKTCCLFYLTSDNGDRCPACPIECKKQVEH